MPAGHGVLLGLSMQAPAPLHWRQGESQPGAVPPATTKYPVSEQHSEPGRHGRHDPSWHLPAAHDVPFARFRQPPFPSHSRHSALQPMSLVPAARKVPSGEQQALAGLQARQLPAMHTPAEHVMPSGRSTQEPAPSHCLHSLAHPVSGSPAPTYCPSSPQQADAGSQGRHSPPTHHAVPAAHRVRSGRGTHPPAPSHCRHSAMQLRPALPAGTNPPSEPQQVVAG